MSAFPVTDWQRLQRLAEGSEEERRAVEAELFVRYREPILAFLRGRGIEAERAEDLLHDFFAYALEQKFFQQADASRGRFRNLLLTGLQRFARGQHRAAQAQRRAPAGGFVPADASEVPEEALPVESNSPERAFLRGWAETLVRRVIAALEDEYAGPGRKAHREVFRRLLVEPILEGAAAPSQRELAAELGLTEKEVANRLVTTRQAYQRLLRAEIRTYARSDAEVEEEVRELFQQLAET